VTVWGGAAGEDAAVRGQVGEGARCWLPAGVAERVPPRRRGWEERAGAGGRGRGHPAQQPTRGRPAQLDRDRRARCRRRGCGGAGRRRKVAAAGGHRRPARRQLLPDRQSRLRRQGRRRPVAARRRRRWRHRPRHRLARRDRCRRALGLPLLGGNHLRHLLPIGGLGPRLERGVLRLGRLRGALGLVLLRVLLRAPGVRQVRFGPAGVRARRVVAGGRVLGLGGWP
jgi:hypothetical protein